MYDIHMIWSVKQACPRNLSIYIHNKTDSDLCAEAYTHGTVYKGGPCKCTCMHLIFKSPGSLQTGRHREKQRKRGLQREDMLSTVHLFKMLVGEWFRKVGVTQPHRHCALDCTSEKRLRTTAQCDPFPGQKQSKYISLSSSQVPASVRRHDDISLAFAII